MPPTKADFGYPRRERADTERSGKVTVLAIDPGGTTGWAVMTLDESVLTNSRIALGVNNIDFDYGQIDCGSRRGELADNGISSGEYLGIRDLLKLCSEHANAIVVIEDFVLRQFRQDRDLLSPVRVTAGVGYGLWLMGRSYYTQGPADAKRVCTDAALKQWGFYDSGSGVHARDATRHAILMLRKLKSNRAFREEVMGNQ